MSHLNMSIKKYVRFIVVRLNKLECQLMKHVIANDRFISRHHMKASGLSWQVEV